AGGDAPPRPPLRVDPRRVPGLGGRGRSRPRLPGQIPPGRDGRPGGRPADADGCLQQENRGPGSAGMTRELTVPELSLVVLIGASGSGKSTFGRAHFRPTEVISSDFCRGLVADDENDQSATPQAFELLHYIAGQRLKAGRLTVVDATNVQPDARRRLVAIAREHDVLPVPLLLHAPVPAVPEQGCRGPNEAGPARDSGAHVIRRQRDQLRRGLKGLPREGFRTVHTLRGEDEVAGVSITRTKLFSDLRHEAGPFDVIGDINGCRAEHEALQAALGYTISRMH